MGAAERSALGQRGKRDLRLRLSLCFQQQKKKRDTRKGRRKKDVDDDGEEKELLERLQKLSVPASDDEEGDGNDGGGAPHSSIQESSFSSCLILLLCHFSSCPEIPRREESQGKPSLGKRPPVCNPDHSVTSPALSFPREATRLQP